jgi:hypothetical protein
MIIIGDSSALRCPAQTFTRGDVLRRFYAQLPSVLGNAPAVGNTPVVVDALIGPNTVAPNSHPALDPSNAASNRT